MTKSESYILKGIAILFMLFHHLFGKAARYAEYGLTGLIINEEITLTIAKDLKVCVAIFVFVSGYGMCKKAIAQNTNGRIGIKYDKDILKAYRDLIKDTVFLLPVCVLCSIVLGLSKTPTAVWEGEQLGSIVYGMIANMSGTAGFFDVNWFISSWWYLEVAILFIVLFPLLYFLLKKIGGTILLLLSILVIPYVLHFNVSQDTLWRYLPAFICGMVIADWKVVEKLRNWVEEKGYSKVGATVLLTFLLGLSVFLKHTIKANFVIQSGQAVVLALLASLVISGIPLLSGGLETFGRNSKYIWLIHVFIYGQLIKDFLFEMKNIWLIFAVLSVISLLTAIVLKWVLVQIETQVVKIRRRKG